MQVSAGIYDLPDSRPDDATVTRLSVRDQVAMQRVRLISETFRKISVENRVMIFSGSF